MQDFRQLKVWEKGHALALTVYRATQNFPQHELYGITSQMRRSRPQCRQTSLRAAGVSASDFRKFLDYSMGSAKELAYQLLLSRDLGYLPPEDYDRILMDVTEIQRMLSAFIARLRQQS